MDRVRRQGVTVRKTIGCLIATCCIENGYSLLHADRDSTRSRATSDCESRRSEASALWDNGRVLPDTQVNLLYPLDEFYARAGRPLPSIERLDGPDVPEPFRSLLVHDRDMTPTMAAAHEGTVGLRVLEHWFGGDAYSRLIVLTATGRPVLFGAIKIYLHRFPDEARALVLEDRLPFGTILQVSAITHASRPLAFFRAASDAFINSALGLDGSLLLHGRRNVLSNARGEPLAQVFEILAPR